MSQHGLGVWSCPNPACKGVNLAQETHCRSCHNVKPAPSPFRAALAARKRIPPVDLQDFLEQHGEAFAVAMSVNGEVFLTLTPHSGNPAMFRVEHNDLQPCDNFGRPSW